MGVGPVNYSFTFAELENKVNGTYNRGELRLDAKGGLHRANNHVWAQVFNDKTTTAQENLNVRTAVFDSIASHFSKSGGVSQYLKAAQEFLLGSENALKPLSRDEVRAIIAQLKSVSTMAVDNAKDELYRAEEQLEKANSDNIALAKKCENMSLESEITQEDVDNDVSICKQYQKELQPLTEEYNAKYGEYVKDMVKVRDLFANDEGVRPLLDDLEDSVESMIKDFEKWTSDCVVNAKNEGGRLKLKNNVYLRKENFNSCWKELSEKTDEEGKKLMGKFMGSFNRLYDAADDMYNKEIYLRQAESKRDRHELDLNAQKQVDELVKTRQQLETAISKNKGNVAGLRNQLKIVNEKIREIRRQFRLDDLRAAGTLTQKDMERVEVLKEEAQQKVDDAEKNVSAAKVRLANERAHDLSINDFRLLLKTIRAVKEGANTVSRTEDGGFKLNGSHRAFDSRMVLSGLRSGMGREEIVGMSTVNHGAVAVRARGADTLEAMDARSEAQTRFDEEVTQFGEKLTDRLSKGFVGMKGQNLRQCEVTVKLVKAMLDELDTSVVPGLKESLVPDLEALKKDFDEALEKIKESGPSTRRTNDNDYRHFLDLAVRRLNVFKLSDSIEVTEARNRLSDELDKLLRGNLIEASAPERKPETLNKHDLSFIDTVENAIAEKPIFKFDLAHWNTPVSDVAAEAAQVLVDAFAAKSGIDVSSFAPGLVKEIKEETGSFEDFVKNFTEGLNKSKLYPSEGPKREECDKLLEAMDGGSIVFESVVRPDQRLVKFGDVIANKFEEIFTGKKMVAEERMLSQLGEKAQLYGEVVFNMEELAGFFIDSLADICDMTNDPNLLPIDEMRSAHKDFVAGKMSPKDFSNMIFDAVSSLPGGISLDSMAFKITLQMPPEFWDPPEKLVD